MQYTLLMPKYLQDLSLVSCTTLKLSTSTLVVHSLKKLKTKNIMLKNTEKIYPTYTIYPTELESNLYPMTHSPNTGVGT